MICESWVGTILTWELYEMIHEIEMMGWYEFNMRHERVVINVA